jgi:hypothetical protein
MMDCERFTDIVAAGEDASPREVAEAREHAARCEECGRLAEAFKAFEAAEAEVPPAPAGFASRVMARLPLGREAAWRELPARAAPFPKWVVSGIAAGACAVLACVVSYFAYSDPAAFAATADAFGNAAAPDANVFGSMIGAFIAAVAVAGSLAYYYLVPGD